MKRYDSVVIGAGPAGMSAVLYLARFGLSVALLEKSTPGGLLLETAEIENYPGLPKMQGYVLADTLEAQLSSYPVDRLPLTAHSCEKAEDGYILRTDEDPLEARTVIICSGLRHRKLELPGEDRLTGHGLSYCAICDGPFFRGLTVAVAGGGNSALEEALYLSGLVKELHLIHRRDAFRADRLIQEKVLAVPNVVVHYNTVIEALLGEENLRGLTLRSTLASERQSCDLPVDGLFVFVGQTPAADFFPAGLQVDEAGFIITDTEMCSNLPGIFAAGDIRSKRCRQVVTAAGDGASAARSAYLFLEEKHVLKN
ncbi:MAG: FAD-dependent oxidoreductase [Desulfovibrionaceae bacterium]|nr:FAD-dependent oxidoreductase [Desulfovibrionaceae bacterium]